jgi:hypothetical protein
MFYLCCPRDAYKLKVLPAFVCTRREGDFLVVFTVCVRPDRSIRDTRG